MARFSVSSGTVTTEPVVISPAGSPPTICWASTISRAALAESRQVAREENPAADTSDSAYRHRDRGADALGERSGKQCPERAPCP